MFLSVLGVSTCHWAWPWHSQEEKKGESGGGEPRSCQVSQAGLWHEVGWAWFVCFTGTWKPNSSSFVYWYSNAMLKIREIFSKECDQIWLLFLSLVSSANFDISGLVETAGENSGRKGRKKSSRVSIVLFKKRFLVWLWFFCTDITS